jgi:hypothetical protein
MDMERLLREVEKRLSGLDEVHKAEALDAMREEFARERRRVNALAHRGDGARAARGG